MNKYQESIDIIKDFVLVDGACCDDEVLVNAIDTIQNLLFQYEMRLCDAELLNELRAITGTMGDLDLKHKVKRLMEANKWTSIVNH